MLWLLLIFAAVCAVCMIYTGYLHYDKQLNNEAEMLKVSAEQAAAGIDMQFNKLEAASVTLLADQEYVEFDAADFSLNNEYRITQKLAELKDGVTRLSLIDNYCDFTLLYRNDAAAGKLSEGSRELLCDDDGNVYPRLTELLGDNKSVWITGVDGNFDKVYYISQANEHALFLGGFYTEELRYMVAGAERLEDSILILDDGSGSRIMTMSTAEREIEPDNVEDESYAMVEDSFVQAGKTLDNGWKVILVKDMTTTFEMYKKLALEVSVVVVLTLAIMVVIYLLNFKDSPVYGGTPVIAPEVDMLTGITNAEEAENIVADRLETCVSGSTFMLAVVKIINMAELEKRYGRAGYNGSIIKTYRGLAEYFGTDDPESPNVLGRTGEGEFIVMADYTQYDLFKANDALRAGLVQLSEAMNCITLANEGDMHICIGAAVYPHNSTDYDELYEMAEKALEDAINDDERCYAIYRKEKGAHKW
ncbi:MAG: diguanylate cyclase [Ruminococcus sp.]|nr:diguanylate cyclase [Ruminococcus sp.]